MKKERIGLFGGTFNPVHAGHLKAAEIVQKRFILNKILFIPSYIPPHKDTAEIASPSHRLKMVEIALRGYPRFMPSSIEIDAEETSYSIITINRIKKLYPKFWIFFILGIDAFLEVDTWKDYEQLLEQCFFVVISRPGYLLDKAKETLEGKYRKEMCMISKSESLKEEMLLSFRIFLLPIEALDIASTEIRGIIKRGDSIKGMVSEGVEDYIKENGLYKI
ncbi:MAG: nicotinate (nicotinamide) nucleotide adenylyltransferase [Candidatus Aminicenantes bacterium]|nr:nicotinate (nicotinamide) nucleotide adenylyltransferase [Candidatus Aminicenantes bacterium]